MKETEILLSTLQLVRNLTKLYISQLPENAVYTEPNVNGTKFNSAYWIIAHLVWTEHFLLIQGVLNENMDIKWIDHFALGSSNEKKEGLPDYKEVLQTFDEVYSKAIEGIRQMPVEELDNENHVDAVFGGVNSKRAIINHMIRHEPMHVGQLSWILKMNGITIA